ncbi:putative pentatricopeptide repeat-containing protein [Tanacetum coccineum]
MSDLIPFDIQSEIMKRLPVKSLIQFRSVSKKWKSFIDSPKFIKNYHITHTNPQHHLLVRCELDTSQTCTSIIDNNTFPQQKVPLTAPESLSLLRNTLTLSSIDGLLYFCGDVDSKTRMAVIWNPTVRKSVGIAIPIPKAGYKRIIVGFGVCPDTSDPKLVKISATNIPSMWEVQVFTLSTRFWKTVYMGAPFKSCNLMWFQVFVNGVIYFRASDFNFVNQVRSNFIISFDLKSEKFGEVCLPERLVHTPYLDLDVAKVNESLGLLEYYAEGDMRVCGVWTRNDGDNKTFSKIYTVKVVGKSLLSRVLTFRNNGEVVMQLDDDNNHECRIEVYEPLSGLISGVGINGNQRTFSARSYMETLLLLDESDSIIH